MSQQDIADLTKFKTFATVQKWETEKSEPRIETVKIIADYFGYTLDEIILKDIEREGLLGHPPTESAVDTEFSVD